jgi:hypothetical protein
MVFSCALVQAGSYCWHATFTYAGAIMIGVGYFLLAYAGSPNETLSRGIAASISNALIGAGVVVGVHGIMTSPLDQLWRQQEANLTESAQGDVSS